MFRHIYMSLGHMDLQIWVQSDTWAGVFYGQFWTLFFLFQLVSPNLQKQHGTSTIGSIMRFFSWMNLVAVCFVLNQNRKLETHFIMFRNLNVFVWHLWMMMPQIAETQHFVSFNMISPSPRGYSDHDVSMWEEIESECSLWAWLVGLEIG